MYICIICLFSGLCLLTSFACCAAAGRAEQVAVNWEREHPPVALTEYRDTENPHTAPKTTDK